MRTWPVVRIVPPPSATADELESLCDRLVADGATGYVELPSSMHAPDGHPSLPDLDVSFPELTPADRAAHRGDELLAGWVSATRLACLYTWPASGAIVLGRLVDEEDWGKPWWDTFTVAPAGRRIWVGPPGHKRLPREAPADAVLLRIPQNRAFGTGLHPTTRGCLEMLETEVTPHSTLLDVGTGSGVLAVAGLKLGADYAVGLDPDPHSEPAFEATAKANGVAKRALFVAGSTLAVAVGGSLIHGFPMPDIVVCNMLSAEFDALLSPMAKLRRPLILSGFLESEQLNVAGRLAETGWKVLRRNVIDEWATWLCKAE